MKDENKMLQRGKRRFAIYLVLKRNNQDCFNLTEI